MAPVLKVYGPARSWNIARVLTSLEEAGAEYEIVAMDYSVAEYEIVAMDYSVAEHKSTAHLARNPFGQVPVLQDGDFFLWESRAITKYICRKCKPELLRAGNLEESAMVDVWLEVEAQQYRPPVEAILMEIIIRPMLGQPADEKVVGENMEKLKEVLEVYEARLSSSRYLAGDFVSLADLNHASTMLRLSTTRCISLLDAYPCVGVWWDGLRSRPAARKVAELMGVSGE